MDEQEVEIVTPEEKQELKVETLLQLLAVFIRRFGGEVVLTQREYAMVEGLPVLVRQVTPERIRLRLVEDYELCDCGEIHLDDE